MCRDMSSKQGVHNSTHYRHGCGVAPQHCSELSNRDLTSKVDPQPQLQFLHKLAAFVESFSFSITLGWILILNQESVDQVLSQMMSLRLLFMMCCCWLLENSWHPPVLEWVKKNLSPARSASNCRLMRQLKVGPTSPVSTVSSRPPGKISSLAYP